MNWITDRVPTREDADDDGSVIALSFSGRKWYTVHWADIPFGKAWIPFRALEQSPRSEQRSFAQIAIGHGNGYAVALADDGTAWMYIPSDSTWRQLPSLPKRQQEDS